MATQTFPCPFCGHRMSVPAELLGRKVRCPRAECRQVLVAPAPAPAAAPPPVVVAAPLPPPIAAPQGEIPVFSFKPPEETDSIFSEEQHGPDDEVFGLGRETRPVVPEMPPEVGRPADPPAVVTVPRPPGAVPSEPLFAPVPAAPHNPFSGFEPTTTVAPIPAPVAPAAPRPVPAAYPPPPVHAVPHPSAAANPWSGFGGDAAPAPATVVAAPARTAPPPSAPAIPTAPLRAAADIPDEDELPPEPARPTRPHGRRRAAAPGAGGGVSKVALFALIPYALIMTGLAVYGLFIKSGGEAPKGHPLSTIPDNVGEFPAADRKKLGQNAPKFDDKLPPELTVALGRTLDIGALQVEPLGVEIRPLTVVREAKGSNEKREVSAPPGVVLRLKIRNTSDDLTVHPLDPAFNRTARGTDQPATGLEVGGKTFWGGPIAWPFPSNVAREYEAAQEADAAPLKPHEAREYVVLSDTKPAVVKGVRGAKDPILWRVQVRRGLVEYRGREVPVTAVIGIEFTAADVKDGA